MSADLIFKMKLEGNISPELQKINNKFEQAKTTANSFARQIQTLSSQKQGILSGAIAADFGNIKALQAQVNKLKQDYAAMGAGSEKRKLGLDIKNLNTRILAEYNQELTRLNNKYKRASYSANVFGKTLDSLNGKAKRSIGVWGRFKKAIISSHRATTAYSGANTNLINGFVRHIRRVESMAVALYALSRAYKSTLGAGIEFNKQMEDSGIAITAIIASTSKNQTKSGRSVNEAEKWKIAAEEARNYIKEIVKMNAQTPTNLADTTKIFQILLPQMRQHNATMEDSLKLTKLVSIATVAGNVSMIEAKQALDGLLNGTTKSSAELMVYFKTLGITNEKLREMGKKELTGDMVKNMQKSGEVVEYLIDVLGRLEPAGALLADSWKGRMTVLKNEWDTTMAQAALPLMDSFKNSMTEMTEFIKVNRDQWILDIRVFFLDMQDMGTSVKEVYQEISASFTELLNFAGINENIGTLREGFVWLTEAIRENKTVIGEVILAYAGIKLGGGIISGIAKLTYGAEGATIAMTALGKAGRFLLRGGLLGAGIAWLITKFTGFQFSFENLAKVASLSWAYIKKGMYGLVTGIGQGINKIHSLWSQLGAGMSNTWKSIIDWIGSAWHGMINGLASALNNFLNSAVSKINTVINKINSIPLLNANISMITDFNIKGLGAYKSALKEAKADTKDFLDLSFLQKDQNAINSTIDKLKEEITNTLDKTSEGQLNSPPKDNIAIAIATLKEENAKLEQKLADSLASRDTPKEDVKPSKSALASAKRLADQKLKWEQNLNDTYFKNTNSQYDYEKKKINNKWDLALKRGLDAHKVEMNRRIELGNLDAKMYDQRVKADKKTATGWNKATQARANRGIGASGGTSGQKALTAYRDNLKKERVAQIESWGNAVKEMGKFFKNTQLEAAGSLINQLGKIFVNGKGAFSGSGLGGTIDKLLGADTYSASAASLGGSLGGAIGGLFGNAAGGKFIGELGGMIVGGLFGKTKKTGEGFIVTDAINSLNELDENVKTYESFKKKSWLRTKRWDKTKDLTAQTIMQLEGIYNSFELLLARMGDFKLGSINAGQYGTIGGGFAEAFFEGLVEENYVAVKHGFAGILGGTKNIFSDMQRRTLAASWENYAKEVKKDVGEVILEAFSKFEDVRTDFKKLSDTSKYKLPTLKNAIDEANRAVLQYAIEGVTKENFLEKSQQAKTNNTLTKEMITKWTNLGLALNNSTKATTAYENALKSQSKATYTSIKKINDLWLGKYSPFTMLQKTDYSNKIADLAVNNPNYSRTDTAQKALETAFKSATTNEGYVKEFIRLNNALEKDVKDATNKDLLDELIRLRKEVEELKEINNDSNTIALQRTA